MKDGDLVLLRGTMWSSYSREGEVGMLLETKTMTDFDGDGAPSAEFSRVLWSKDGMLGFVKSEHLEAVNESR